MAVLTVLIWALWHLEVLKLSDNLRDEAVFGTLFFMLTLSFPTGPLLLFVMHQVIHLAYPGLFEGTGSVVTAEALFTWITCFIGGYLQWFVLVPSIYARFKKST